MKTLSDRLRLAMADSGHTQVSLAKSVGMRQPSMHAILTGATQKSKFLPELARALGVRYEWLVTGEGRGF